MIIIADQDHRMFYFKEKFDEKFLGREITKKIKEVV